MATMFEYAVTVPAAVSVAVAAVTGWAVTVPAAVRVAAAVVTPPSAAPRHTARAVLRRRARPPVAGCA